MKHIDSSTELIKLTQKLIQFKSITPSDGGLHDELIKFLRPLGFEIFLFNKNNTSNLYAKFNQDQHPKILFAGHSDVVPPGDESHWSENPFSGTLQHGKIWGRGACDMKGNLAAMLLAVKNILNQSNFLGSLHFIITSDEEGNATFGTQYVVNQLMKENQTFDYTIVGEPSSSKTTGDTLRIGRRGSINAKVTLKDQQYHVAYAPSQTLFTKLNQIITSLQNLELSSHEFFPKSQLHITHIEDCNTATNVIPDILNLCFNIRFNPNNDVKSLQNIIKNTLNEWSQDISIEWEVSAYPFVSQPGTLASMFTKAIQEEMNITPKLNTGGGTSDARFLHKISNEIIEFGCKNSTAHQVDEHIELDDLNHTYQIYYRFLKNFI